MTVTGSSNVRNLDILSDLVRIDKLRVVHPEKVIATEWISTGLDQNIDRQCTNMLFRI
jgi:hypothetical protein